MQNLRKWGAWLGAGAVLFALAGCADKDNSGQAESPAAANEVPGAVADNFGDTANAVTGAAGAVGNAVTGAGAAAGNAVAGAGNAVAGGAENVAGAAGNVAEGAGNAVGGVGNAVENNVKATGGAIAGLAAAATITPKVKSAILANAAMKGTTINVDALPAKDSLAIRGKVKTAQQKNLATQIAQKNSAGYKIVNQLTVGG